MTARDIFAPKQKNKITQNYTAVLTLYCKNLKKNHIILSCDICNVSKNYFDLINIFHDWEGHICPGLPNNIIFFRT